MCVLFVLCVPCVLSVNVACCMGPLKRGAVCSPYSTHLGISAQLLQKAAMRGNRVFCLPVRQTADGHV